MLKSWSIKNFKPIVDSGELELAPVTILAGRNSSGKSSLLQSILMIAQTLSNRLLDRPLLPNERLVQLGTFEDILSEFSNSRTTTISFMLEIDDEEFFEDVHYDEQGIAWNKHEYEPDIKSIKITTTFQSAKQNGATVSAIEASKVLVESGLLEIVAHKPVRNLHFSTAFGFNFHFHKISEEEINQISKEFIGEKRPGLSYNPDQYNYIGKLEAIYEFEEPESIVKRNVNSCLLTLTHFLPQQFIPISAPEEELKQSIRSHLSFLFQLPSSILQNKKMLDPFQGLLLQMPLSKEAKYSIQEFCKQENFDNSISVQSLYQLILWFSSLEDRIANDRLNYLKERLLEILIPYLTIEGAEAQTIVNSIDQEENQYVLYGAGLVNSFFSRQIRNLGPLRIDPGIISQHFAPISELDEVGAKGEYAAVVYHYNQLAVIEWYNPQTKEVERGTLQNALDTWVRYLGVADQVRAEMAGLTGVSWKVVLKEGQKSRTLPEVGVGISQILPILVMGLLAPKRTLLIIEQPELHLHPSVQARLGDFFVGLSKCNKQCLIETHSENLVSQIRYHIVQAGGMEKSDCMIYFVNQDEQGAAQFERVEISPQGNILNWPEGFFDETMLQEDRITAASIRKRANKAKNA